MEFSAALVVFILCVAVGSLAVSFFSNQDERSLLLRLFAVALLVRTAFTFLIYSAGLVDSLGGADDTAWVSFWFRSRTWGQVGIDPIWSMYNAETIRANPGFAYFGALFFYGLDMLSQMALAVFNGFLNSLTVVLIYKMAREFFSVKSAAFAAWVAVFMPSFLIWSALTIKETWLILFEIATCYCVLILYRRSGVLRIGALLLIPVLVALTAAFRFYVAWFLIAGILISLATYRAQRPVRAATISTFGVAIFFIILSQLQIIKFDLITITQEQITEITKYRENLADPRFGGASSVSLPFDTSTPSGALLMLIVGSTYVLLSPFPWQIVSDRQIFALPDVLLWWYLVFLFIIPGLRYAWKFQPALLMSLLSFIIPLLLFYSMMFGNVGLAYRQRAQLMPFFLVLAAARYESRQRQRHSLKRDQKARIAKLLLLRLHAKPSTGHPPL